MRRLTIQEMRLIAKERGGKCLSDTYKGGNIKLRWKCSEGHIWEAIPLRIKHSKTWCPVCGKPKKLTIEEMHKSATELNVKE